jgi:hypothetical protein
VPGFEHDIRPLFRAKDQLAMAYLFDLWSYEDVKEEAENVRDRIEDGTMPCDDRWPEAHIALFSRWIEEGCQP